MSSPEDLFLSSSETHLDSDAQPTCLLFLAALWDLGSLISVISTQGYDRQWSLINADFSFHFLPDFVFCFALLNELFFFPRFLLFFCHPEASKFISFALCPSLIFIISFPRCSQAHLYHNIIPGASHSIIMCVFSCLHLNQSSYLCCLGSDRIDYQ